MSTSEIIHPSSPNGFVSLTHKANKQPISSYICGRLSEGAKDLVLKQILNIAQQGSGFIVDLHGAVTEELLAELPKYAEQFNRKIYHVNLSKKCKESAFVYDPFKGKAEYEAILLAQTLFDTKGISSANAYFGDTSHALVSKIISAHFLFEDQISLKQFYDYIRMDKLPELHQKVQQRFIAQPSEELNDILTVLRPYFFMNGQPVDFNREIYIKHLNGLAGTVALLNFDFGGLLDFTENANKEYLVLAEAIQRGDYIIYDYGYEKIPEIKESLARIMSQDVHLAFLAERTMDNVHYAVFTNYRSLISIATILPILQYGRRSNLSIVPVFESYFDVLENDTFLLYSLNCNVHYQVFFAMDYPETEKSGLSPEQLEICESLEKGSYLLITQGTQLVQTI